MCVSMQECLWVLSDACTVVDPFDPVHKAAELKVTTVTPVLW